MEARERGAERLHAVDLPPEALQAVTERVARLNAPLNAFAVMTPQALAAAGASEARWRAGRPIGPRRAVVHRQ